MAQAAIAVIESGGIEQLTMRSVAAELGAGTMTLYTHVRGREDLLDAVVERLIAELDMPGVTARTAGDWRAHLTVVLDAYRQLADRFPRSFELLALAPYSERAVAPHLAEAERVLAEAGLGGEKARAALGIADAFATGFLVVRARTVIRSGGAGGAGGAGGIGDTGVSAAEQTHATASYELGVRAVIAGIEATVALAE